jgi:hypothetical protein
LAKTSPTRRRRCTSSSGQARLDGERTKARLPTMRPPATIGMARFDGHAPAERLGVSHRFPP